MSAQSHSHLSTALKKVGAMYRYTELPGADHAASAQKGYGDPEVIAWLLQQHR